jgi:hypothetical protein
MPMHRYSVLFCGVASEALIVRVKFGNNEVSGLFRPPWVELQFGLLFATTHSQLSLIHEQKCESRW